MGCSLNGLPLECYILHLLIRTPDCYRKSVENPVLAHQNVDQLFSHHPAPPGFLDRKRDLAATAGPTA